MNSISLSKNNLVNYLKELFPNASCELNYRNNFELLIAVILSAQTHDRSVNQVTKILFEYYSTPEAIASAKLEDLERIIHPIGLSKRKSLAIQNISKELVIKYNGKIPETLAELEAIKGIGRKTASVILIEGFKKPAFPVDTHIMRIAKRLRLADLKDNVLVIEKKLRAFFPEEDWIFVHHLLIHFGRYFCKAKNPECTKCQIKKNCREANT